MKTGNEKPVVMIFLDWYLPGFKAGGPVRTAVNMVARLRNDFDFRIVTRNTDLNETKPYPGIKSDSWVTAPDGIPAYYFSQRQLSLRNIKKLILDIQPDAVHLNSMFSFYFTMLPLLVLKNSGIVCRVVLGPRGMLSSGALSIKPLKKKLFLGAAKTFGLFRNVTWHASTPVEREEIYKTFGKNIPVQLAIDLAPEIKIRKLIREKKSGYAKLYFLGRVSEVKNLLFNIRVLKNLSTECSVDFHIYGPVEEPAYWELCKKEIESLPENVRVTYKGNLDNSLLHETLRDYHFLFLMTKNENYGHAIVESLVEGCPVIISDRTPWRNLSSRKAGWDLSIDQTEPVTRVIEETCRMNQETYTLWSENAGMMADSIVNNPQSLLDNKKLFHTSGAVTG